MFSCYMFLTILWTFQMWTILIGIFFNYVLFSLGTSCIRWACFRCSDCWKDFQLCSFFPYNFFPLLHFQWCSILPYNFLQKILIFWSWNCFDWYIFNHEENKYFNIEYHFSQNKVYKISTVIRNHYPWVFSSFFLTFSIMSCFTNLINSIYTHIYIHICIQKNHVFNFTHD